MVVFGYYPWELKRASMLVKVGSFFAQLRFITMDNLNFVITILIYTKHCFFSCWGSAKIDVNVDLTHKLCAALMLSPFRFFSLTLCLNQIFGRKGKERKGKERGTEEDWCVFFQIYCKSLLCQQCGGLLLPIPFPPFPFLPLLISK